MLICCLYLRTHTSICDHGIVLKLTSECNKICIICSLYSYPFWAFYWQFIATSCISGVTLKCHTLLLPLWLFSVEDIHLNSRTFLWPKEMEAVLKLSEARLSHRRDIVEGVLRSKQTDFDAKWVDHYWNYNKHVLW